MNTESFVKVLYPALVMRTILSVCLMVFTLHGARPEGDQAWLMVKG